MNMCASSAGADNQPVGLVDGTDGKEQPCRFAGIGAEPSVIPTHTHIEIQGMAYAYAQQCRHKSVHRDRIAALNDAEAFWALNAIVFGCIIVENTYCTIYVSIVFEYRVVVINVLAVIYQEHLLKQAASGGLGSAGQRVKAVRGRYDDVFTVTVQQAGVYFALISVA